ncbi:hypothetical protein ACFQZ4_09790 [Catellatospora coxensis]
MPGGLVITAAHAVGPVGSAVSVRRLHEHELHPGTVIWSRNDHAVDAALIRVPDAIDPGDLAALRWGQLVCGAGTVRVEAVGFPSSTVDPDDGARDTEHLAGTVRQSASAKSGRLDIAADKPPDDWFGMSGAGLFCNERFVGVIARANPHFPQTRVSGVHLATLADDPEFAALAWPGEMKSRPGLEPAELVSLQQPVEPPLSPASLLRADAAVVPFSGQEDLIERLHGWCTEPLPKSAFLITGTAGRGKTRTARHFADQMRRAGWATVVLATSTLEPEAVQQLASVHQPLLLVIDFAEHRSEQMAVLGKALNERTHATPLRVLLLARRAGEWRTQLPAGLGFAISATTHNHRELRTLDTPEERRVAFAQAVRSFAAGLHRLSERGGIAPRDWDIIAAAVQTPHLPGPMTALDVQLTALVSLLRAGGPTDGDDVVTEARDLLSNHEAEYWQRIAARHGLHLHSDTQEVAVAAACLLPAADRDQAIAILGRVPEIEELTQDRKGAVAAWLEDLYPSSADFWGGLRPDLLAEHLVAKALGRNTKILPVLLAQVDQRQARQAMTMLAAAAGPRAFLQDQISAVMATHPRSLATAAVQVALEAADPKPLRRALSSLVAAQGNDLALMQLLYHCIPNRTEVHSKLAADIAGHVVAGLQRRAPRRARSPLAFLSARTQESEASLARAIDSHAVRLAALGRGKEALAKARQAVAISQRLARANANSYLGTYAMTLNNLSNCLYDLGLQAEGLEVSRQAVTAYRQLLPRCPHS